MHAVSAPQAPAGCWTGCWRIPAGGRGLTQRKQGGRQRRRLGRMRPRLAGLAAAALLPLLAAAQQFAVTATTANLYSGPDYRYPVVVALSPGAHVTLQGCVTDYAWCDVSFGYDRGWVIGSSLYYEHRGAFVPLPSVAAVAGVPFVSFQIEDYWGVYYLARPWYGDRHRWSHLPGGPPPGRPAYRPPGLGVQPPQAPSRPGPAAGPEPRGHGFSR
jgi:uncharacterized protein YraI